jgi:hypothetical protein
VLSPQLKRNAVVRPNAKTNLFGNLHNACSPLKLGTGAFKGAGVIEWPTKCFAISHGPLKASMDPLPDHDALKLGKGADDLKPQPAGWRRVSIDCWSIKRSTPQLSRCWTVARRSTRERPSRSIAQVITTSNLPLLASLSI